MPDRGVRPSFTTELERHVRLAASGNHTTTQQWQSFEMRMRYRRAERCRLRAEIAMEAGFPDDAVEALEEARRLRPDLPGLISTEERLALSALPQPPAAPPRPMRRRWIAAAASMTLALGFAGWLLSGDPAMPPASAVATKAAATVPAPLSKANTTGSVRVEPATVVSDAPSPTVTADTTGVARDAPKDVVNEDEPVPSRPSAKPQVTAAPIIEVPPPPPPRSTRGTDVRPRTIITADPATPANVPSATTPPLASPAATLTPLAAEPARQPDVHVDPRPDPVVSAPAEPSAEVKVRSTLSRYEAAYSTLNARAARAVWPSVDATALGRAFDSLQAQQISLGNCSVLVTGLSARANCAGSATWTPKVGGGTRTEPRRWTFDLEQSGDRWEIVRATTR